MEKNQVFAFAPWPLLGTLRHSMPPYIHSRTVLLHSDDSWSIEIDKLQKVRKSSSERNFLENEHIFKTLIPVNLGLHNFPAPFEHAIRTGTNQSLLETDLEQIRPQGAEQSQFLSKYFWKKRIAFLPRFARLLSYKVLLFERRWISVSTSQIAKSMEIACRDKMHLLSKSDTL